MRGCECVPLERRAALSLYGLLDFLDFLDFGVGSSGRKFSYDADTPPPPHSQVQCMPVGATTVMVAGDTPNNLNNDKLGEFIRRLGKEVNGRPIYSQAGRHKEGGGREGGSKEGGRPPLSERCM